MQEKQVQSLVKEDEQGNGSPLWHSCLENFMDIGVWRVRPQSMGS